MTDNHLSQSRAVEDFLKAVYTLQEQMGRVSTNALAAALDRKAPTVTDMARRLEESGLIHYRKYRGVVLTEAGEAVALRVLRRHRLIELYLVTELDYPLQEVHDEAEKLEHAVSDRFIEAIAEKLGHPEIDPHGDPIPTSEGLLIDRTLIPLIALPQDTQARVARYTTDDAEMLQFILSRDFQLNARVTVSSKDPFDGPLTVMVNDKEQVIGHITASYIMVEIEEN